MPIIHLEDNIHNTCVDRLRQLIYYFSAQTRKELLDFFPTESESLIDNSLAILESRGEIQKKEYMEDTYYYEKKYKSVFERYWDIRIHFQSSLDLLRLMLNSTDEKGYLVNDIPYIGIGNNPCTLYFLCNRKLFEVYSIPEEDVEYLVYLIQTKDSQDKYITDPHNPRIVIVDNEGYIDKIVIKNVSYFAVYDKQSRTFSLKEGSHL